VNPVLTGSLITGVRVRSNAVAATQHRERAPGMAEAKGGHSPESRQVALGTIHDVDGDALSLAEAKEVLSRWA
jgi:hypothetical protein